MRLNVRSVEATDAPDTYRVTAAGWVQLSGTHGGHVEHEVSFFVSRDRLAEFAPGLGVTVTIEAVGHGG